MLTTRSVASIFSLAMIALGTDVASGQAYPNKPIRVVTSEAGGGTDFTARVIAPGISGPLGQKLVVDNRVAGVIPVEIVAKAPPDGYTLLFAASPFWIVPLMQKTSYDPVRDFSPITLVTNAPQIVVVHPSVAANSIKELIVLAKAKPGTLNYLSTGTGSTNHLAGELFNAMAGVNLVHVPYKGGGSAITGLLGNEVQMRFGTGAAVEPYVKVGKLRALAVTSTQPSVLFPGLPTVAATVPGYEWVSYTVMAAPIKTPVAIITRLNQEVARLLAQPEVKQKFLIAGAETLGSSPEEFTAKMKSEMTRMGKVIKDAGIRTE